MGDGFWTEGTVLLCTDSFTKVEVDLLVVALINVFNIKAREE